MNAEVKFTFELTGQEFNTVLAALRYYQARGMGDPANRPLWLHEIATGDAMDNEEVSLDSAAIEELCQRMNCG